MRPWRRFMTVKWYQLRPHDRLRDGRYIKEISWIWTRRLGSTGVKLVVGRYSVQRLDGLSLLVWDDLEEIEAQHSMEIHRR